MYGWGYGDGGWWMIAAMAIVAVAIVVSVWLVTHRSTDGHPSRSTAEDLLRERFARGEITAEQFSEAKRLLGDR